MKLTGFFLGAEEDREDELGSWFGTRVKEEIF
jgi:ribonuclease H2 subunit A